MSIQKKSLISALKTTKKANVAAAGTETPKGESLTSMKLAGAQHDQLQEGDPAQTVLAVEERKPSNPSGSCRGRK